MTDGATPNQVAAWMAAELERTSYLYQDTVAYAIRANFGDDFTYNNANGNLAISPQVLKLFKKLTGADVIWERGSRMWRKRKSYDKPGRQQY